MRIENREELVVIGEGQQLILGKNASHTFF